MSDETVHRSLASRAGWFLAFVPLGMLSVELTAAPAEGHGLISLPVIPCLVSWAVMAIVSGAGFAGCCPRLSWFALVGWLLGQTGLLTWDMRPQGSPTAFFALIDTLQAFLYALVLVATLNWTIAPGFIVGRIVKWMRKRPKFAAKTSSGPTPAGAK